MPHSVHNTPGSTTPVIPEQSGLPLGQRFWNANLPETKWTEECPDFLLGQGQKNISILSANEDDYHYLTWPESKELVNTNRIDHFQRPPLQLRRYLQFMFKLKREYGSVLSFVQQERLCWNSISPSSEPLFTNPADYKILYNDWPYGIDHDISHLVVWTKFLLDDDPETGFLTAEHHKLIEDFVQRTFCTGDGINRENLIWFKNWKSLKSVHALEHFHVMLYRASPEFLKSITNGDKPMSETISDS
ncbi:hypothetical protein PMZ80_002454 [Knufia obscura]|uniref:N-acetylglucosamine-induced protein 1 n=2 Tax=Knufia TaxID=430999 RepID=A0AAN8I291_9EURO|nr:hypothetical protein PMZ80_002454 [Knufia obscura]KAK5950837.1 hypothetical protein OHC33_008220 [Knufia fluminis]